MEQTKRYQPVTVSNAAACKLISQRAERESRSKANAAAVTIVEALQSKSDSIEESKEGQG